MKKLNTPSRSYLLSDDNKIKAIQGLFEQSNTQTDAFNAISGGSGAFANVPTSPSVGQMYYCTDKQTEEGATDGIIIVYNGTSWVDALGRTIT